LNFAARKINIFSRPEQLVDEAVHMACFYKKSKIIKSMSTVPEPTVDQPTLRM
jgi:hypothetical protein